MKTRQDWIKWMQVTLFVALAGLAIAALVAVNRGHQAATVAAQGIPCEQAEMELVDGLCSSIESDREALEMIEGEFDVVTINPSPSYEDDVLAQVEADGIALEQVERARYTSSGYNAVAEPWTETDQVALALMDGELGTAHSDASPGYEDDVLAQVEADRIAFQQMERMQLASSGYAAVAEPWTETDQVALALMEGELDVVTINPSSNYEDDVLAQIEADRIAFEEMKEKLYTVQSSP